MLKELRVKNYKSLEDVAIPLRPLTVFVGPNNAGKSNILDCLLFLRELLELGAPSVTSRGGFRYIVWGGDLKRQIEIKLEAESELSAILPTDKGPPEHIVKGF